MVEGGRGVTLVAGPAGSGKTVLLRSWVAAAGVADRVAWVSVERGERDAQGFWLSVIDELRAVASAEAVVEKLTPTPEFEGEAIVERLVAQLGSLKEPVVLVIDDLHELVSREALAQLEVLLARRPELLRVVLASHRDPQLGLHRLRLTDQLIEIRAAELRFTIEEARELLATAGITLADETLALLHARTEGWAAGLRLAALSLAGHPDPERFVVEFSGSERMVADYLLAEVLDRQPEEVRRLLLRTSVLERVTAPLCDHLVQGSGSERILLALEEANAFVISLDANRSWFRYHQLFADLLRLELRRTDPEAVPQLHRTAAKWYEEHGYPVEAIRHAQAAQDWQYAIRLVADNALALTFNGQMGTVNALLAAFPPDAASDPELALRFAWRELTHGSLEEAAGYIALAERTASAVAEERRRGFEVALAVVRLSLARRRGDLGTVLDQVLGLLGPAEAETLSDVALGTDLRAFALFHLGVGEQWSLRLEDAVRHFEQGLELARRSGRSFMEVACLGRLGLVDTAESFARARERCAEAIAIAEAQGWGDHPGVCVALATMGMADAWQGGFGDGANWLDRAERALRGQGDPGVELLVRFARGMVLIGEGELEQALASLRAALELQSRLVTAHTLTGQARQFLVHTLLRLSDVDSARATLADLAEEELESGEARAARAALQLTDSDAHAAAETLAPVLDGSTPALREFTVIEALLLDAMARDLLDDAQAAEADIERALELAEPDELVFPFVLIQPGDLLERHPRHRTAHPRLLADVLDVLAGASRPARADEAAGVREGFTEAELRVLRYLPSRLSAPEIGSELYISLNTVKTHMRHIYAKLGVHGRTEAVERARALGLLTVSSLRR
jgi:LuxR family maltose regulon positive regulatory protein